MSAVDSLCDHKFYINVLLSGVQKPKISHNMKHQKIPVDCLVSCVTWFDTDDDDDGDGTEELDFTR